MKLIAILLLLAVISIPVFTGCSSSSTGPSGPVNYFPVAMGNRWTMTMSGFVIPAGVDTVTVTGTFERTVIDTTTHAMGYKLWVMEEISATTFTQGDTTVTYRDTSYAYTMESDSELVAYDDTITTEYEILVKLPVTVGETWEPYTDDNSVTREILSISTIVSVPAGSFSSCLHLQDTDSEAPDDNWEMWSAPGIGPCRVETDAVDSSEVIHIEGELQSYLIN